tara:strand:- start:79 stop:603 length:525 start_codon:yes stop_codon:yes gene_type:complete
MNWWEQFLDENNEMNVTDLQNANLEGALTNEQFEFLANLITDAGLYDDAFANPAMVSQLENFTQAQDTWNLASSLIDQPPETETAMGYMPQLETMMGEYDTFWDSATGIADLSSISNYIDTFENYQGAQDFTGGGGTGGDFARSTYYPQQETGFAGVGEAVQTTLDELLPGGGQ